MFDYDLYIPTHVIFGKGRIKDLPAQLSKFGCKVLLTYGGGSIKKIGLYDTVKSLLKDFEVFELPGIEPNPKIGSVREGVAICKKEHIDVILAVGGGSVIDASKNIACGACFDGDPWDLVLDCSKVEKALPIVSVLTLTATGSEYDGSAVISNPETNEKLPLFGTGILEPKVSFLDPEYTYSVPKSQTIAGAADIISHTLEQYIVKDGNILTDAMCEGVIKTVIKYTKIAIEDPCNYEARAQLMMVSSYGCSGNLATGRTPSPWVCHAIEHEISAYTDITHGYGLAIITPHWMNYSLNEDTVDRFYQFAVNVFDLEKSSDKMKVAKAGIAKLAAFYKEIGLPSTLSELKVGSEHFEDMANHVLTHWQPLDTAIRPVDKQGILEILKASL
ncbi:MAG: iron-containing alcohol dehydrogenase [Succinivibrio sp.]|nr:iron-containing alcohol dehydrogenase [Succinivibrio sp.]MCI6449819.1 iron-containing alcohol dehydrogenase [Succinivibrio sp.]MDY4991803.1 iron-containing alcohol dehydrogenase [Succinivibrio sp.]HAO91485.1 NADH-dependent alcohol dehydrogenase [Succinivibrio sp.]